jgi:hypothetical protein
MLPWVGVVIGMLSSLSEARVTRPVPAQVLSPALVVSAPQEQTTEARLKGWVSGLALLRPGGGGTSEAFSPVLFVAVAPVRGTVGVWAVGTF